MAVIARGVRTAAAASPARPWSWQARAALSVSRSASGTAGFRPSASSAPRMPSSASPLPPRAMPWVPAALM